MVALRLMTLADSDWALTQMARERWSSYAGWIHAHLAHDPEGCFVAEVDGERAGMVTSTAFGNTGWIGNLIVTPPFRRRGIGARLMEHARARLCDAGLRTVRIDADPPGMGIYKRMGFVERHASLRFWSRDARARAHPAVRPMTTGDLPRVAAFDRTRFGDDRARFLDLLAGMCARALVLYDDGDDLHGFTFVIPTQDGAQLGPTVARDVAAARALVEHGAYAADAPALVTGIPETNTAGCALLRELGFTEGSPSRRMVWGDASAVTEDPATIFAIASGACG